MSEIHTLFLDIGGVILTNGWDRRIRAKAIERFRLEEEEVNERHHLTFDTYEEGKLDLAEYLDGVIFYRERSFSREEFRTFMLEQSAELPEMAGLLRRLKRRHGLRLVAVSNEGRELTEHRIRTFRLDEYIDTFVSSCFVHFRKPDRDIYRLALDVAHAVPESVFYVDDRAMFVEAARGLGIRGVAHRSPAETARALAEVGLALGEEPKTEQGRTGR